MSIWKCFQMAMSSIVGNKMRSILTMLGIIIGITAVIALVSLMSGMTFRMDISLRFCLCKSRFEHEIYFLLHAEQAP